MDGLSPDSSVIDSVTNVQISVLQKTYVCNVMFGTHERELTVVVISSLQHTDFQGWMITNGFCSKEDARGGGICRRHEENYLFIYLFFRCYVEAKTKKEAESSNATASKVEKGEKVYQYHWQYDHLQAPPLHSEQRV
jgi:hypothetical protein